MSEQLKVVIVDYYYDSLEREKAIFAPHGFHVEDYHCKTEDEVIAVAQDADALIVQFAPITRHVIESLKKCRCIVRYAIGVDNIDVRAATEHDIYVCNVPDYSLDEVSNQAITLLLACARKLTLMDRLVRQGVWKYQPSMPLYRMEGKRLGLVGLGRIPSLVARKIAGFGLDIIAYDPYRSEEYAKMLGVKLVSLDELLETSDYVSLHCPLTEQTHHLIDRAALGKMKKTAILVNTARGGVVNQVDLAEALAAGTIAMAGLDVCEKEPIEKDSPLLSMDNVIITPHMSWYTQEAVQSLQTKVAEEVARVLTGQKPANPVNQN